MFWYCFGLVLYECEQNTQFQVLVSIPSPSIGALLAICVSKDSSYFGLTQVLQICFVHKVLDVSSHLPVQVDLKNAARLLQATPLITLISICVLICSLLPAL